MKLITLEIIFVSIIAFLTANFVKNWDESTSIAVFIVLAISSVVVTHLVSYTSKEFSDPKVKVEISSNEGQKIFIITAQNFVQSLNLFLPLDGEVIEIHEYIGSSNTKQTKLINAKSKFFINQKTSYQSTLYLTLENILPHKQLRYVMQFRPLEDVSSPAYENYKISYAWNHNGNIQYQEKWISFAAGKQVKEPPVQVGSFTTHK